MVLQKEQNSGKQLPAAKPLHPLLCPSPVVLASSQSFSPHPTLCPAKGNAQNKSRARWKGMWGSKKKPPARKEVKKLSIEESAKVATRPGLVSVNVSPLISFTSRGYCGSVLCWKPFSRLKMPHCFSGPCFSWAGSGNVLCLGWTMASPPVLKLHRLFSDLDTLQWTLFNNFFF